MAESRYGVPLVVTEGSGQFSCERLERVPFSDVESEDWLQRVLAQSPELLPIAAIDERVETPLLSLGREIPTPVGPIDDLFLSRNGYLVLVETKLWRNPEARREVIAQIIDYAAQLRKWTYADVENAYPIRRLRFEPVGDRGARGSR